MPFKNLGNDPETAFYEFSLADAVITELARVRSLVVRPSSVIVKYQGQQFDPGDVGRELSVDAILTASFLRAKDHLRVTVQLLDVRTSEILWSDRIDADASDIIAVQDTIVQHIVDGLRVELSPDEKVELAKGIDERRRGIGRIFARAPLPGPVYLPHNCARRSGFGNQPLRASYRAGSEFCPRPLCVGKLLRQSSAQGAGGSKGS